MKIEKILNPNKLLEHIHISNNNLTAKIYPNLGGSLQELIVNRVNIIDGISNDNAGLHDYANSYKSSILFPFPNRIEDGTYEYMGLTHQLSVNEVSVNNSIHGLVYNKEFKVTSMKSDENMATVALTYHSNGLALGFPFAYELKLTYKISANGSLKLRFDIANIGNLPFPYGMGWHPYFKTEQFSTSTLSFPSKDFYACNERSLPIKTLASPLPATFKMKDKKFDDAYSLHKSECSFESNSYKLHFDFDYPEGSYLQVYTPPHGKSIAIEPMTCVANSFNNGIGLKELHTGKSDCWEIHMKLEMKL